MRKSSEKLNSRFVLIGCYTFIHSFSKCFANIILQVWNRRNAQTTAANCVLRSSLNSSVGLENLEAQFNK
jgi:hypothetical protein